MPHTHQGILKVFIPLRLFLHFYIKITSVDVHTDPDSRQTEPIYLLLCVCLFKRMNPLYTTEMYHRVDSLKSRQTSQTEPCRKNNNPNTTTNVCRSVSCERLTDF